MDIKELATKVIDGGNVEEVIKDLDEPKKAEFFKELTSLRKVASDKELETINARRLELKRLGEKNLDGENKAIETVRSQIRGEQMDLAFQKAENILNSKGITLTPEDKVKLKTDFAKYDSGKFDSNLIVPDVLTAYAAAHADKLLDDASHRVTLEKNAAEYNAGGASSGSIGAGAPDNGKTYSPQVNDWVREARTRGIILTPEQAERGLKGGNWEPKVK